MNPSYDPTRVTGLIAGIRGLLIAAALCVSGQVNAAAPDLTAGGVATDSDQWNLGPTGMAGWCYKEGISSASSRQFLVRSVAAGSPAAGIMAVNDVILGASGTGANPVNFTQDARIAFGNAITDAEAQSPATLKILRWRAGVTSIVSLTLETLGAYSATAPYNCPKSAAILEKGLQYMMNTNANDGNWRFSAMTLLAANDPANPNNAARQAKATTELRQLILSPATIARYMSAKSVYGDAKPWHVGPQLIALSEYYLKTGDPDVLPSIRAYAHCIANGQSMFGTCGHVFSNPGFRNAPVNGPYNQGYGPVNNAALPCYIGLILANKCGLNDPEILAGIERAGTFYAQYTHLGCAGYGEHLPYEGHDNNGKAGLQALAFQLEGDRLESTRYYARASAAAAIAERDIGHSGSFFAFLYAPLGANVGGPDAMAYYFRETRWMYELARRWDGSFVYNSFSSGGIEVDSLVGQGGCLMATPMLLTYALPLRQTYLTGKDQDTANWITPAEMPEVSAASAHIYDAPSRTTTELVSDLASWSPKVRRYAGRELKLRTADHAGVLPTLHATAANESATIYARAGACLAMGEIGNSSSVPVLLPLVTHPNYVVRFSASLAIRYMPAAANKPHVTALMQACITNSKPLLPLDPEDPMQTVNGNLCSALFAPHAALYTHDLVGLDRELLYGAMRVCASNAQAEVRNGLHNIYPKLTQTDVDKVADMFVSIAYESAPAGMGTPLAREPAMSFLQSRGKAEGVPLAIRLAEDYGYDNGMIATAISVLADYAGSSNTVTPNPDVDHFCQVLIASGAKYGIPEAQAVLDAIAADLSPDVLTPFKSIDWIIPDHATFNLPRKSTVLRVHSKNRSNSTSTYTWRKLRGAGAVSFYPNGTSAAKDATVVFDGIPGEYLFEVTMSDSHGLTEVSETVEVTLRNSGGTLPPNSPPTANAQSLTAAQGAPTQVVLTGADPEGYALSYTVTGGPTHGYLSGTAPHLVYTAAANYTGADSISFKVEDSEGQFAIATVSITVNASAPVGLALYEPFNYAVGNLQGKSGASEIGLAGTWTAGSQLTTEAPSLTYGTLPSTGNRVRSVSINSPGGSRPVSPAALANRGLLDNGATLWFSVVMAGYGGYDASGNLFHLALGNNSISYTFPSSYYIPNDGSIPGSGLGVRLKNKGVYAAQFAATGDPLIGTYDNTVTGGIINDNPRLVVGKITWGAASDSIEIYLPEDDMVLTAPTSVLTANVDQSTFDTLTFSRGSNVLFDEIRFGATLQSVMQGTVAMSADVTAPTPNPMTFAVAPAPASSSSITMAAAPAHDGMGVEYLFACTAGGGNSSGWQDSNVYTDSGLTPGVAYSYTVKARDKHPALNETAASAAASATIPALGTVPGVTELPQSFAQSLIANAALTVGTVTQSAGYSMTVPAGHVLSQSPSGGAAVAYGSPVNLVISIGQNPVLPVLAPASIVDNKNGEQVEVGNPITYTLTFSKDINAATLGTGDFINVGDAPVTIGSVTEISPGIVTVTVTPTGTVGGILRFAVAAGSLIEDTLGNDLNTTSAIIDDTVISIVPVQPKTQTFTGISSSGADNWNTVSNWNLNTGPIPTGTDNVIISANKQVTSNSAATPIYSGNLALGLGAHLQSGYNLANINIYNCLGTPGSTTISMAEGSRISFRENYSPVVPAITLQGNAEITMGSSSNGGTDPVFNYPISGPYTLTLNGKSDCLANFNVANNFEHIVLSTQYGSLFTVNANTAGALGGDVTVKADYATGSKGANLIINAGNAMPDTATLTLYGNTGSLITLNASDSIGGLKLNGVKQLPGTYNSGNSTWITGAGALTVAGESMAYWNPSGGPSGTWDDSNIWNNLPTLIGTNSAWTPGRIASFNATGTHAVTLSGTKEIGGLVVPNGEVTLLGGALSLSLEAPLNVGSGATLAINTVIEQNSLGLGLHKSGAGTLNLLGENTFTGSVAIGAGILSISTIDNAGVPSALGQYPDAGIGGLILAGGTFRYTGGTTSVNRGFTFSGSSTININNAGSSLTLGNVETAGPGTLTVSGGAGSSLGLGNLKIVQSNNITLNPTTTAMSVASVEGYSAYPLGATITLGGSSTGNIVTGSISAGVYPGSAYQQGTAVVKTGAGDWRLAGALTAGPVVNNNITVNEGTLILAGNNTYTGNTLVNNASTLVLDFAATNTSKIGGGLVLAGGTLEMKGGSHLEVVGNATLNAGPTAFITRNGGTAKLRMNAITRNAGSSILFLDGTVADTDRTNTNGILGGYATLGADWAVNNTNGADGAIGAFSSYAAWTQSGGSATANYLLNGDSALTGPVAANSLKLVSTASNQTLNLGASNLTITSTNATALGGVLYSGGASDRYSISGSGGLLASSTTGELILHAQGGTLIVNAPVVTSGATSGLLTKTGNGSLVLGGANVYTGATRVAKGKLFINGSLSNVSANLTVDSGATLGGSGTVGRNITIADGGKLEFNLGAPAASHVPLTRSSGRTMAFSGSSVLTITATAGAAPGLYTLITGGNNLTGSAPAAVILPPGWTADPPVISGNQLRIQITSTPPPPNAIPVWSGNPLTENDANEDAAYSATLSDNASDGDNNPLAFAKVSGPSWLGVATNGSLSGTPNNNDVGLNGFVVSVSDGIAAPVQATLNITVANSNDAPVWQSNPLVGSDATEDIPYSQTLAAAATDVDAGAVLTFAKSSGPAWLNVAGNGIITGTPSNADVGLNVFTVSVSDGIAAPVQTTLHVEVLNTNDAPYFTANPIVLAPGSENAAYTGQTLAGTATDIDLGDTLTYSKISGPAWLAVAANGALSGTPPFGAAGMNSFVVRATDSASATADATLQITVATSPLVWDANGATAGQTNGAGAWLGANLWWNGTANQSWVSGASATIGGPSGAGGAITLASPTTVNAITFNTFTGTYTLGTAGQALTINGGINKTATSGSVTFASTSSVILGAAQTWANNSSGALTVGAQNSDTPLNNGGNLLTIDGNGSTYLKWGVMSGSGGLTKNGTGYLEIGGQYSAVTHTYTGITTLNGGTMRVNGDTGVGGLGSGNLTINGGVLEYYYGGTFTRTLGSAPGQVQILGGISGFGSGNSATFTLNNSSAFEAVWGSTFFNPSTLALNTATYGGTTTLANKLDLNGVTRTIQVGTGTGVISGVIRTSSGSAGLTKTGGGTLALSAANTYVGDTTISGGILRIGNNTAGTLGNGTYNANISVAAGSTLQVWSTANQTLSGVISGAGGLAKAYAGTLTLSAANTYTGKTSLTPQTTAGAGTLSVSSFNSVVGGTASSSLGAPTTVANATIDFGSATAQGGATLKYTGAGETTDRVINFLFNGNGATKTLDASGSGLLKFTSNFTGSGSTNNFIALTGTGNGEITGGLPFTFSSLSKSGNGTWTLGGTVVNTGTTTVSAGKLFISGSISNVAAALDVSSGATLGGTGTIGRNVTIAAGGKLEFNLDTSAASHDHLDIGSGRSFAFSGASALTITSSGGAEPGIYTLVTGGNNISGSAPATLNLPAGWEATVSISGNSLLLNVTSTGSGGSQMMMMLADSTSSSEGGTTSSGSIAEGTTGGAATATDDSAQAAALELPLPWTSTDIGSGMIAGSTTQSAGTFTQAGSGIVGSTADKIRYTYQTLTGDGEITAKISSLQDTGNPSRIGVMIRDSLAPNSREIFMGMAGTNTYRWDRRTTTGGATSSSRGGTGTVPNTWIRLVRSGSTITAYRSADGTSWTLVGSTANTTFASTCYIGLAVGSGSDTTLNTSQFSNVSVTP